MPDLSGLRFWRCDVDETLVVDRQWVSPGAIRAWPADHTPSDDRLVEVKRDGTPLESGAPVEAALAEGSLAAEPAPAEPAPADPAPADPTPFLDPALADQPMPTDESGLVQ